MLENNELYKKVLQSLDEEQKKVQDNFERFELETKEYNEVLKKVVEFLKKKNSENEIDFELLDKFIDYLVKEEYLPEKKDYRKLQQLKLKLMADFADRTEKIDREFDQLFSACEKIKNSQVSKTKSFQRESYKYKSELEYYTQVQAVLEGISKERFISTEELKTLKEYIDTKNLASDEDCAELFQEIILHNAVVLENQYKQVLASIEAKRKVQEEKKKKIKQEKQQKEQPASKKDSKGTRDKDTGEVTVSAPKEEKQVDEFKLDLEDADFKEIYDRINELLEADFKTNEVFLSYVETENLDYERALDMVDAIGDPLTNIKSLLKVKVMPAILAGEVENYKELLFLYLDEYDRYVKQKEKLDWDKKLRDSNNEELLEKIHSAQALIKTCEDMDPQESKGMLKGFLSPVESRVQKVIEHIISSEHTDQAFLDESNEELSTTLQILEDAVKPFIKEDKKFESELLNNSSNLILLSDSVGLDEMIAKEGHTDPNALAIVLDGLENLSKDENIVTTNAHRVQHNREKTEIKSYRKGNWRIFYKVTKADNLEKICHKKMNAIYIVDIGYGGSDGKTKSRMVDRAYHAGVEREPEFSRFVEMLNSDNLDKTMELVISQTSKLKGYIEKSKNSSLGGDPSAK